jgi:fructose-1-phosphate kinase PfkB-like protein
MKKYRFLFVLPLLFGLFSCDEEKKNELLQREQTLFEKEKAFALKEADYQQLVKMRDSLLTVRDTVVAMVSLPDSIAGKWSSRIICIASSCPDHVIGDQRTDLWEFIADNNQVVAKIINNNNLVRVYTGTFDGAQLKLDFKTDSTAAKQIEMHVLMNDIKEGKIRGTRDLIADDCRARFSVELDRVKNQ